MIDITDKLNANRVDRLHTALMDAYNAYGEATKNFHPLQNVADLPEFKELQLRRMHHAYQCKCGIF